jgi:hypothetical protein
MMNQSEAVRPVHLVHEMLDFTALLKALIDETGAGNIGGQLMSHCCFAPQLIKQGRISNHWLCGFVTRSLALRAVGYATQDSAVTVFWMDRVTACVLKALPRSSRRVSHEQPVRRLPDRPTH